MQKHFVTFLCKKKKKLKTLLPFNLFFSFGCHCMGIYQGTAIRDRIQERLRGQQSSDDSFLLQNGKDDENEEYYDDEEEESDEEFYEEYFDDDELNPQNNGKDMNKK